MTTLARGPDRRDGEPSLRLPPLDEKQIPGWRLVRRAGSYILAILFLGAAAGVAVSLLVEIDASVEARGVLEPIQVWEARAIDGAVVESVLVATGDRVTTGQVLLTLDDEELASRRQELTVERDVARVAHEEARTALALRRQTDEERVAALESSLASRVAELRREMLLFQLDGHVDSLIAHHVVGTHVTFDPIVSDVRRIKREIELARDRDEGLRVEALAVDRRALELRRAEMAVDAHDAQIERLAVRAPAPGVILTDHLNRLPGTFVQAGAHVADVADMESWRATLLVSESDVFRIAVGDLVRLDIEPLTTRLRGPLAGEVSFVAPAPEGSGTAAPGGTHYRVLVSIAPEDAVRVDPRLLRSGYSLTARVVTDRGTPAQLLFRALQEDRSGA